MPQRKQKSRSREEGKKGSQMYVFVVNVFSSSETPEREEWEGRLVEEKRVMHGSKLRKHKKQKEKKNNSGTIGI